jgi:hypothetical protein
MRPKNFRNKLAPLAVVAAICTLTAYAVRAGWRPQGRPVAARAPIGEASDSVLAVNAWFESHWRAEGLTPAPPASDLLVLRRLSLALHGTIPSLEEARAFLADEAPDRLERWTERIFADPRFDDYLAERMARMLVGVDNGQFIIFRRDRFVDWLREQLARRRPYDAIVREVVAAEGLWTGQPAANFIAAAFNDGKIDASKLAGRATRAFLGQRIDCAQCHDHPFDSWKQTDFEGLAAFFGQTKISIVGVEETGEGELEVEDRQIAGTHVAILGVPFGPEWLPTDGTRRQRLAGWLTHAANRRFERAVANRAWGWMFGKPLIEPVDDLPDPDDPAAPPHSRVLDLLGEDFRVHGYDLRRLLQVIAGSAPFRVDSASDDPSPTIVDRLEAAGGLFPLVALRPEQVVGSMLQSASIRTIDQRSQWIVRTVRYFREQDFLREYGDAGEDELNPRSGTIPQALLCMNGQLLRELANASPFTAAGRIAALSETDRGAIEAAYLAVLTRRPSAEELAYFSGQLADSAVEGRARAVEDLYWSLCNSPEFGFNH